MTPEVKNRGTANLSTEPRKRLVDYVLKCDLDSKIKGRPLAAFKHEGEWYFRPSWMDGGFLRHVIKNGFVERAWSYGDAEGKKIISLYNSQRNTYLNRQITFYRVKDSEINNEISQRLS